MSMQRSVSRALAGGIALVLGGVFAVASAQTPAQPITPPATTPASVPPAVQPRTSPTPAAQQAPPQTMQQTDTTKFIPATRSSATYPIENGTLTVNTGMPAQVQSYGPPPAFKSLDTNHDGRISQDEAQAYPPIDNDFLYASGGAQSISRSQYEKWANERH